MRALSVLGIAALVGCVYFNALYDANREYDEGVRSAREQSGIVARVHFDSVIEKTGRIVEDHPNSKYADDAAILKARAELSNELWESAVQTSMLAEDLAADSVHRAEALGLRGVAFERLGRYAEADSVLSLALAVELSAEDEALFLFARGLARQHLDEPALAARDLDTAATSVALSPEGSVTLAIALRDIGEYGRSAELTERLLSAASPNPQSPLYLHVDSLAQLAPMVVDSMVTELLAEPGTPPTRRAGYHLIAGRALIALDRDSAALVSFDSAMATASTSLSAADAAWYASEIRLAGANRPQEIGELVRTLQMARRASRLELRHRAIRWNVSAVEFQGLEEAYDSRGASAAEALLRAAEVAELGLEAPALARGNYLLYLREAPDSKWAAKAIFGALSVSGHRPDPSWVADRGSETDVELRRRLESLPVDDPYRLALSRRDPGFMADSMYMMAEADLQRRLMEIQVLYDPTAADTAVTGAPETPTEPEGDEIKN